MIDWVGLFVSFVVAAFCGALLKLYFDIKNDEGK